MKNIHHITFDLTMMVQIEYTECPSDMWMEDSVVNCKNVKELC